MARSSGGKAAAPFEAHSMDVDLEVFAKTEEQRERAREVGTLEYPLEDVTNIYGDDDVAST
eukprot:5909913-Prorocentrum_lima.AAC.1